MAKYSLGTATTRIKSTVSKDELHLNSVKANPIEVDMEKQFDVIITSLENLHGYMTKAANKGVVTGDYANAFKGWGKKCKSQASSAKKWKSSLKARYDADTQAYTLKLFDERISELEARIAQMSAE